MFVGQSLAVKSPNSPLQKQLGVEDSLIQRQQIEKLFEKVACLTVTQCYSYIRQATFGLSKHRKLVDNPTPFSFLSPLVVSGLPHQNSRRKSLY